MDGNPKTDSPQEGVENAAIPTHIMGRIKTLNHLIDNERGFVKWSIIRAVSTFLIGVAGSGVLLWLAVAAGKSGTFGETARMLNSIPGISGAAYGIFSIKSYFERKNRMCGSPSALTISISKVEVWLNT